MKLKKSTVEAVEEAKPAAGGAFISARLRNPADEVAVVGTDKSEQLGGILAIVATVLLGIITAVLYLNWEAIKSA